MLLEKRKHTLEIGERSTDNSHSVLKRNAAARQREEWYSHIFQAKAVKVCDVPQENAPEEFIGEREIYRYLLSPITSLVQKDVSRDPQKN